jgi:cold shock CspA family protein
VVVERRHHSHRKGNLFHVQVGLSLSKRQLVVNQPQDRHAHEDVLVALRDAFNAARRRLKRRVQTRRGKIKSHDSPPHGRIVRLFPNEDFGFIAASDGQEIYFHRNSVIEGSFDALDVGSEVSYTGSTGGEGPQASTAKPIGKHHIVS